MESLKISVDETVVNVWCITIQIKAIEQLLLSATLPRSTYCFYSILDVNFMKSRKMKWMVLTPSLEYGILTRYFSIITTLFIHSCILTYFQMSSSVYCTLCVLSLSIQRGSYSFILFSWPRHDLKVVNPLLVSEHKFTSLQ